MANRLLDRQISLLEHLTSGAAIFGKLGGATSSATALGIDAQLLRLEARFSHDKRMEKINSVFPKTLTLLGSRQAAVIRSFAYRCPPLDISRLANARQFHDFLLRRWKRVRPRPAYLPDIVSCELAIAEARVRGAIEVSARSRKPAIQIRRAGIRRHPGAVLVRCSYDVRPVFEHAGGSVATPKRRNTPLAFILRSAAGEPDVYNLHPVVFKLLVSLDDWVDPATLEIELPLKAILDELSRHGLVEVRSS